VPVGLPSNELQPLCHEHHIEMKLKQILVTTGTERTPVLAYGCPEPDCWVHYSTSPGIFHPHPERDWDRHSLDATGQMRTGWNADVSR